MRLAVALLLLSSAAVEAAPYCVQGAGLPPQCLYYDVMACRTEAQHSNAICALNPNEVQPPRGQRFCAVWNGPVVQCLYADRRTCDAAAAQGKGICIDAGDPTSRPDPDLVPR
jgi:hypothetical protein